MRNTLTCSGKPNLEMSDHLLGEGPEDELLADIFGAAINPSGFEVKGYQIENEIDRGGMGIVYRARQLHPEREVALKVMLPQHAYDETMRKRFFREIRAMASLDHGGILPIYEVGEADQMPFFSMKLAEGGSLAELLQRHSEGLSPSEAVTLVKAVALALHHAHQKGVLHRDIKPGNLLFGKSGRIYVSDFGVAKLAETDLWGLTRTENFVGTPDYIPPELIEKADESTMAGDIYSLGAVFYECLTGRKPFQGAKNLASHLRAVLEEPVVAPSRYRSKIPKDLETICLKTLAKNPAERYSSADEFAKDLSRWERGLPVVARPLNLVQRSWRFVKRNAVLSISTFLLATILATSAGVVFTQRAEARKKDRLRLFSLHVQQARTERLLGKPGFRQKVLSHLAQAKEIGSSPQIMDEAIAALATPDFIKIETGLVNEDEDEKLAASFPDRQGIERVFEENETAVALARDGLGRVTLWPAGKDSPIRVWVPSEGDRIVCEFLPDGGGLLVAGHEMGLARYDLKTGAFLERLPEPPGRITEIIISPQGSKVAVGGHFGIGVIDRKTFAWDWLHKDPPLRCEPTWSQDGTLLVAALGDQKEVKAFVAANGKEHYTFRTTGWAESMALDPFGRYAVVSSDDKRVSVFDLNKRKPLAQLSGAATFMQFCENGSRLKIGGANGRYSLWSFESPLGYYAWLSSFPSESSLTFRKASLSPDHRWLLLVFNECLQIYSVEERKLMSYYATNHQRIDSPAGAWWLPEKSGRILLQVPGAWDVLEVLDDGSIRYEKPSPKRVPGVKIVDINSAGDWRVNVLDENGQIEGEIWEKGKAAARALTVQEEELSLPQTQGSSKLYHARILENNLIEVRSKSGRVFHLTFPEGASVKHLFFLDDKERLVCVGYNNQLVEWNLREIRRHLKEIGLHSSDW